MERIFNAITDNEVATASVLDDKIVLNFHAIGDKPSLLYLQHDLHEDAKYAGQVVRRLLIAMGYPDLGMNLGRQIDESVG